MFCCGHGRCQYPPLVEVMSTAGGAWLLVLQARRPSKPLAVSQTGMASQRSFRAAAGHSHPVLPRGASPGPQTVSSRVPLTTQGRPCFGQESFCFILPLGLWVHLTCARGYHVMETGSFHLPGPLGSTGEPRLLPENQ